MPDNRRAAVVNALNESLEIFCCHNETTFDEVISKGLRPVARALEVNRIVIYRCVDVNGKKRLKQTYRWETGTGGITTESLDLLPDAPAINSWFDICLQNKCVNQNLSDMTEGQIAFMNTFGIKSVLMAPVFTYGEFWGCVIFQNHENNRRFDEDCLDLIMSASRICVSSIIRADMTGSAQKNLEALAQSKKMSDMLNKTAVTFLSSRDKPFGDMMNEGINLIAGAINIDRLTIWRNSARGKLLYASQIYRWDKESGGTTEVLEIFRDVAYSGFAPRWEEVLSGGKIINSPIRLLPEAAMLKSFGALSICVVPVTIDDGFWGFAIFEDRSKERWFDGGSAEIMRSAAFLCVNTVIRAEMETEVVTSLFEAKEASRAKSEFLSRVSHEMLTPMNAVMGMSQIAKMSSSPEKIKECLSKLDEASRHLLRLIHDLLDISGGKDGGKFGPDNAVFDFSVMFRGILKETGGGALKKQQTLTFNIDPAIPEVLTGDERRLSTVINNLLSNAVKFTPEYGKIHIDASAAGENKQNGTIELQFEISDNGIGISKKHQREIFSIFEQVDGGLARKQGGAGLGLPISKRIAEMMGGEIKVDSEPGRGSKFTFTCKLFTQN